MTTHQKILLGGLGALTPIIINLLVADLRVLLLGLTTLTFLGYVIRVVILFYLGGLVAFLHKDETSPLKLFELGIVAPTLITGLINAGNIDIPKTGQAPGGQPVSSIHFVLPAYAQRPQEERVKTFSLPQGNLAQQFLRGLTGSKFERTWFVIVGSHLKLEDAERQVQQIQRTRPDFKAEVYAPYGGNPYYAVVIGANLTYEEAQRLRQQTIAAGFRKDTYLWTLPK